MAMTVRRFLGAFGTVPDACVTVCVRPPIVSVPVRELPVEFGATVNVIVRDPEPDVLNVIQLADDVAVQKQPDATVSETVASPPPGNTAWLAGLME
jgi:hypothetical protein